jgi:hypothetical protein
MITNKARQGTTLVHETKKQKLIAMSRSVYSDATEYEIKCDTLQFTKQMLDYRQQIRNKRKRIGELLGLPLVGGYDDVDEELMGMLAASAATPNKEGVAAADRKDEEEQSVAMTKERIHDTEPTTKIASNNKNKLDVALSESILLTRHETIKMETNVSHLREQLAEVCTNNNTAKNDDTPGTSIIDIINDNNTLNDVIFSRMKNKVTTPPTNNSGGSTMITKEGGGGVRRLRLASRTIQNDGEEIVIYEHC